MPDYISPGVYVEEIPGNIPSIVCVVTAVPAFIGYTECAFDADNNESLLFRTRKINSITEYEKFFGGPFSENISISVDDTLDGDGLLLERKVQAAPDKPSDFRMYYQLQMYFLNGGGPCYIMSVGDYGQEITAPPDSSGGLTRGLKETEGTDEPTIILFPDGPALESLESYTALIDSALAQCDRRKDRFVISDIYGDDISAFRSALGNNSLKYGAAYYPNLITTLSYGYDESALEISAHLVNGIPATTGSLEGETLDSQRISQPDLYELICDEIEKINVTLSPCGSIAGIYCLVDRMRGVWKAPANISLKSVLGPTIEIDDVEQGLLNVDSVAGKSINAIREFTGRGILVWGARTLAGNDNEWRYVPVRRLFNMLEESITKGTKWVVFEPNDANTWARVKTMIDTFLTKLWRDGALQGAKPEDAFYVKVGLGTTMTSQDIKEGRLLIEIGCAAVRPAEFIILQFSHSMSNL